ncbi:restriction endonuclease subunit S [Paracoccus fontiphilus]|uniref:Restriction endonuclease subunit S n=1 Tax=Paracoccus fontiphilus TaxID=1815556 RepID=A0ABV7IAG6_9RHOB|nr:restriction endonuclease subunit S [Paracoccus fontiphilus]
MSELPRGWSVAIIKSVADINPKHDSTTDRETEVSFVRMPAVDEHLGVITTPDIKPLKDVWKGFTHFAEGDVIFAKITPCMENGKTAVARGLNNGLACGSTEFHVLRPTEALNADYIWRYLRQKSFRAEAEAAMTGAVGQRRVPKPFLEERELHLPPIAEQRRIVAKLDRLSAHSAAARDHLAHTTKLATRAKQAILDAETVQATVDCGVVTIEEIADVMFDGPFGSNLKSEDYTAEGVRVVRLENIGVMEFRAEKITFISERKYKTLQRHSLHPEDIVFSSFVADDVRAALIPANLGSAINKADCFCVRCDKNIVDPKYLLFRLSARRTYLDMEDLVHGATRPRIGLKHLKAYKISLPALEQQKAIVRRIEAAFARIDRMTKDTSRAAHLLDQLDERLLAKAFRGELVPQNPEDEPAEALLTRIREARATAPKQKRGRRKETA